MKTPLTIQCLAATAALCLAVSSGLGAPSASIKEKGDGQYEVTFDNEPFTVLHTKGFAKPIVYPVIGPHGVRMTRDYPMKEGTPGEAKDHPHQQSLWFTHGDVNGISFWHLGKDAGKIVTTQVEKVSQQGGQASIEYRDQWVGPDGKVICTDSQKLSFQKAATGWIALDYDITLHASEGELVLGDTKEGTMGIRTHPKLRIDQGANAVNSEGVTGKDIWGKRAQWVDYSNTIDGHQVGVAMLEHPSNPRHPTWWHAREYGLVAANPFGVADFEKKPRGTGNLKVAAGESVRFRYRFIFHEGDAKAVDLAKRFAEYAKVP